VSRTAAGAAFEVVGDHTYAHPGSYQLRVAVRDTGSQSTGTTKTTIAVADAPLTPINGTVVTAYKHVALQPTQTVIAAFTDANSAAAAGDFRATIDWGDGTPLDTTSAVITRSGSTGAVFRVGGAHTYEGPANAKYTITVTVLDEGGSRTVITSTANVLPYGQDRKTQGGSGGSVTPNSAVAVVPHAQALSAARTASVGDLLVPVVPADLLALNDLALDLLVNRSATVPLAARKRPRGGI
jgi:hypothetical protein